MSLQSNFACIFNYLPLRRIVRVLHAFNEHVLNKAVEWFVAQPLHRSRAQKRFSKSLPDSVFQTIPTEASDSALQTLETGPSDMEHGPETTTVALESKSLKPYWIVSSLTGYV